MNVAEAQREVRTVYLGGAVGQLVSGVLWLTAAAVATAVAPRTGFLVLALGGTMIFPITQAVLRAMGRPATLSDANPLRHLAMQIAFTVPLVLPLAAAAAMHRLAWFFPACMIIVGAHYLPFVFLYGMRMFAVLAGILVSAGLAIGLWVPGPVALGGWVGGGVLVVFAGVLWRIASRESAAELAS